MGAGPIKSIGLQILQHILLKLVIDIHKRVFSLKVPTIYLKFVILAFAIYLCTYLCPLGPTAIELKCSFTYTYLFHFGCASVMISLSCISKTFLDATSSLGP